MASGYLAKSATNTTGMSFNAMLYCKTNIGGYFFDAFTEIQHSSNLEITEHPVETGAAIVDHAYVRPKTLDMTVLVSDVHRSIIENQFTERYARHVAAWDVLKKMHEDRIPVSVLTGYGIYENMLLKSISVTENSDTYNLMIAKVSLVEIPVARVRTVKISSNPNATEIGLSTNSVAAVPAAISTPNNLAPAVIGTALSTAAGRLLG